MKKIHFVSGLPRSGSTLLAGLLAQNPRFHANISGPVAGMFNALLGNMSARNECAVFITDEVRHRMLHGLFVNYYDELTAAEIIFDTNRYWCTKLPALKILVPRSRVIACVREITWVLDSIERLIRINAFQPSSIFSFKPDGTVYSRVEKLLAGDGLVGFAYNALKEAYFGENSANLMLLQYSTLTSEPKRALAAIYDFIGEPQFEHDFQHVRLDNEEFDVRAGTPGLHRIREKVGAVRRKSILPPDLFMRFKNDVFWRDAKLNPRGVRVV